MATDKNTLKNWFKTGLKPLQAHFWAWLDSYWHKDEKIPMQNIEGIDTALENKAETTAVDAKANADASGLGNENIAKWKEALGVGELPENIATIDQNGALGNVHTKEQITELLENSGKNIGNSDMKVPEGVERVLDLTNAKMLFKGLENKKGDASFNRRLKANERGELVYTDDADINVYMPENVSVSGMGNQTITVNHIYPNTIPDRAPILEGIQELMGQFKNLQFKPFVAEDFTINNLEDGDTSPRSVFANGAVRLQNNPQNKNRGEVFTNAISRVFPHNKQWAIKLNIQYSAYHEADAFVGLTQDSNPNNLFATGMIGVALWSTWSENWSGLSNTVNMKVWDSELNLIITHANNIIYACTTNNKGETRTKVIGNFDENGDYRILARLSRVNASRSGLKTTISGAYWIEE